MIITVYLFIMNLETNFNFYYFTMSDKAKAQEGTMKTSLGIEENLEAALAYLFGWVTGLLFLLLEKENKFVKFHAIQSILFNIAYIIVIVPLAIIGAFMPDFIALMFTLLQCGVGLVGFFMWVFLMYKAYSKEMYKLPVIGDLAEKEANK